MILRNKLTKTRHTFVCKNKIQWIAHRTIFSFFFSYFFSYNKQISLRFLKTSDINKLVCMFIFFFSNVDTGSGSDVKSGMSCVHQFSKFMAKFQESLLCRTEEATKFSRSIVGQRACKTKNWTWPTTPTAIRQNNIGYRPFCRLRHRRKPTKNPEKCFT